MLTYERSKHPAGVVTPDVVWHRLLHEASLGGLGSLTTARQRSALDAAILNVSRRPAAPDPAIPHVELGSAHLAGDLNLLNAVYHKTKHDLISSRLDLLEYFRPEHQLAAIRLHVV
jgi:hypothetical protein